jgi:hypothetical protein
MSGALQVCDESHFFEFVDASDKRVVLHFFWVVVSLHRLRRLVMQDTSVAVVGAKKAGKGATLNALFSVGVKSGFAQAFTTRTVESFRCHNGHSRASAYASSYVGLQAVTLIFLSAHFSLSIPH